MPLVAPTDNLATAATANALADKIATQLAAKYSMRSFRPGAVGVGNEPAGASNRRSEPVATYVLSGRLTGRPAQGDIVIDLQTVAVDTGAVSWSGQFQSPMDGDPASLDGIAMQFHYVSNGQSTKLALDFRRHCKPAFVLYHAPAFVD